MIHINTELRVAWRTGLAEALKRNSDAVAPLGCFQICEGCKDGSASPS